MDSYFVAVKLLLREGNKLLIIHDVFDSWDIPGGRIRKDEFNRPIESVILRKINEELGPNLRYRVGAPSVIFRVEREEVGLDGKEIRIFAVGYEAEYLGGAIELGKHHDAMKWVGLQTFQPEKYFKGGWLTGIQEYINNQRWRG
jgi:8-oxo-dGTP diphosphatase